MHSSGGEEEEGEIRLKLRAFLEATAHALANLLLLHGHRKLALDIAEGTNVTLGIPPGEWFACREAEIVADYLLYNDTVTEVWLNEHSIRSDGVQLLCYVLSGNQRIVAVGLHQNPLVRRAAVGGDAPVGSDAAKALLAMFETNVAIQHLTLYRCQLAEEDVQAIQLLVKRNRRAIPAAVRRTCLYLIAVRRTLNCDGMGIFGKCPKEIVRLISMHVWETRRDPVWLQAINLK